MAQEPIRIGAINPYSGPVALYGDEVARGYQLAIDEANAKGGVIGRKIELLRGDAGNPQQGIAAVEKLVSDKVDIFVGTYISAVSNAASDAALRYSKIYWDTNALAAELTARGLPNFVRSGPYASSFADVSANAVKDLLGPAIGKPVKGLKVWIESEDSIYGTSIAKQQKELLEKEGVVVTGVGAHNFRATDLTDSVLRAKNAAPDIWINTGYVPDGNLLLRTMREQGFKPAAILLVGTGDTFETLELARCRISRGHHGRRLSASGPDRGLRPRRRRLSRGLQGEVSARSDRPAGHGRLCGREDADRGDRGSRLRRHGEGARGRRQDGQAGEELRDRLWPEVRRAVPEHARVPDGGAVAVRQDRHGVSEGSRAAERQARQSAAQVD